ncbi:MAG: malate synthase [Gemmatimonadetes bacterium]|jgi:malate synthase|nr:malate synthase [Gemmatimonadota bacterium]
MPVSPSGPTPPAAAIPGSERVLTADAMAFVVHLQRRFGARRAELLEARPARRAALAAHPTGTALDFPADTKTVREADWQVAPSPADLTDRRVEITGPVDRKMMINALNSGARVFMADLEDACSPTWENVVQGQLNLMEAVRRTLAMESGGKQYRLGETLATLVVRPRGWHLEERHLQVDGVPASASLVDFGLYFFHNARELLAAGSGPYFYLPKLEHHLEARLWNEVFVAAQEALGVPRGSIRATVLIETLPAAFEMEEILYELREHAAGLNAGRWDYLFSFIKTFRGRPDKLLPDRAQLTMTVPFMRAYTERLVHVCHRRGAHAIGGMAAFIPSRRDAEVNERALVRVREDKERESRDGFDGSWVAHPDLVPVARAVFDAALGDRPHQKHRRRDDVRTTADQLIDAAVPGGMVTDGGVRMNVEIALLYLESWLRGAGAVAIHNLMEDAATAEISRSQLWQWIEHGAAIDGAGTMTREYYQRVRADTLGRLQSAPDPGARLADAAALLDALVLGPFEEFLTVPGYRLLEG